MPVDDKPTSWWQTLPGLLTAVAGLITAASGLVALLFQHGVFDPRTPQAASPNAEAHAPAAATQGGAVAGGAATSAVAGAAGCDQGREPDASGQCKAAAGAPAAPSASAAAAARVPSSGAEPTVVLSTTDGQQVRLREAGFSHCISTQHELLLDSGQSVPFAKMSGFEVLRADPPQAAGAKAKLQIGLRQGASLEATLDANCDLFGHNDIGRFSIYFERLRSVRFER